MLLPDIFEELKQAYTEYSRAIDNFNNADRDFIETAIAHINYLETKIGALLKRAKEEEENERS